MDFTFQTLFHHHKPDPNRSIPSITKPSESSPSPQFHINNNAQVIFCIRRNRAFITTRRIASTEDADRVLTFTKPEDMAELSRYCQRFGKVACQEQFVFLNGQYVGERF
ncbi:uncharacterized protein RCC_05239 [Ramularia collo-cygni]|uniref:Uncharacterized protein n=1 Tax=Ramularia collo-cygni TaxID=112498 RepID=A0A2D3V1P5_9PEZI|nr:uncharacterized protein RCC_05239 [Ramularia collo-cygni]CZT19390.1 uncharacterized protein RCC_05239 [Ramularia collo-cygni]